MANRAYLYFTDDITTLSFKGHYQKPDGCERSYMDSRHQFPLAWFLFFNSETVRLVPHTEYDWSDLYLAREWNEAKADFLRRAPMLLGWFEGKFAQEDVDLFLVWLESIRDTPNEQYLVADPGELEMEDEQAPAIRAALALLDDALASELQKLKALDVWCGTAYPAEFSRQFDKVFGIYYGPLDGDAFLPRAFRPDEAALGSQVTLFPHENS